MRRRTPQQQAWDKFGLPQIGRATITHYNRHIRPLRPRCGAKRKSDGEPCRNLALPSGKCRLHGGASPRGDEWHKRQWPAGSAPDWQQKLNAKLEQADRDKRRQDQRLAKMSPDERERHNALAASASPRIRGRKSQTTSR